MNWRKLIFKEPPTDMILILKQENEELRDMVNKHYCNDHDRWFSDTRAKSMHDRWHDGNNPFKK